jgi:hypothetical protein
MTDGPYLDLIDLNQAADILQIRPRTVRRYQCRRRLREWWRWNWPCVPLADRAEVEAIRDAMRAYGRRWAGQIDWAAWARWFNWPQRMPWSA